MKPLSTQPNLVEQVHDALLGEITSGQLAPGERVIQEQIARELGVSRQPVQQALVLLRRQGLLVDAPGRGLIVAPLDADQVASRLAAERNAERAAKQGPALIEAGRKAVQSGSVPKMAAADLRFHEFVHGLSGNPLVSPTLAGHLTAMQRVMAEVLAKDETPRDIWDQHEAILEAIASGDGGLAEALARQHIEQAAEFMVARLRREASAA